MSAEQLIFVGFELGDDLQACLESCRERDKVFFEDPTYLEVVDVEDRRLIGKRIDTGAAQDRLEDAARSVVSLLARICPTVEIKTSDAALVALEDAPPVDRVI